MTRTQYVRLHVPIDASDRAVIRAALGKLVARHRFARWNRGDRHAWLRGAIMQHRMAKAGRA